MAQLEASIQTLSGNASRSSFQQTMPLSQTLSSGEGWLYPISGIDPQAVSTAVPLLLTC
jgi:hypothetical protein